MFIYLFICTGWKSKDGGIQTVNRKLSIELAKKHQVYVALENIDATDITHANNFNIQLIECGIDFINLSDKIKELNLDFICTHSIFTGKYLLDIKTKFSQIKYIHFIHHDPEFVEANKDIEKKQVTRNAKKLKELELAINADLIITIGEKLRESYIDDLVDQFSYLEKNVSFLDLGIENEVKEKTYRNSKQPKILLFGRTDSLEVKGVDLFARASSLIDKKLRKSGFEEIKYVVRGEKEENLDLLSKKLNSLAKNKNVNFNIKDFITDEEKLQNEIRSSTVVIMPSRSEGYGLTAMEAISCGVPVIISSRSGVAKLINKHADSESKKAFIWNFGEDKKDIKKFADLVCDCIQSQNSKHTNIKNLKKDLRKVATWERASKKLEKLCESIKDIKIIEDEMHGLSFFMDRKGYYLKLYDRAIEKANHSIDFFALKLNKLRVNQRELLIKKSQTTKIRIALINPLFSETHKHDTIARLREQEENLKKDSIKKDIAEWYDFLNDYNKTHYNLPADYGLEIKLYSFLPTINITKIDNEIFIGNYLLIEENEGKMPTFLFRKEVQKYESIGNSMYDVYSEHFSIVWKKSKNLLDIDEKIISSWKNE